MPVVDTKALKSEILMDRSEVRPEMSSGIQGSSQVLQIGVASREVSNTLQASDTTAHLAEVSMVASTRSSGLTPSRLAAILKELSRVMNRAQISLKQCSKRSKLSVLPRTIGAPLWELPDHSDVAQVPSTWAKSLVNIEILDSHQRHHWRDSCIRTYRMSLGQ